jgi:hypothetical protein
MALRRKGSAPLTEFEVLADRIAAIELELKQLRQPGASSIQADQYDATVDPPPWGMMVHWPGGHRPAQPYSNAIYYHPGRVDQDTGEEVPAGWKQISPPATHAIKVYGDRKSNAPGDGIFKFSIEPDLENTKLVWAGAAHGVAGSTVTTIQISNQTRGFDMLTVPITIPSGEYDSYSGSATPSQIDTGGPTDNPRNKFALGDRIWIDGDAMGTGSKGLHVYMTFA